MVKMEFTLNSVSLMNSVWMHSEAGLFCLGARAKGIWL